MSLQMCNIISFFLSFSCMNWKNHLQAYKCVICFWFFIYVNKKSLVNLQMWNIIFSLYLWVEKTTYEFTSVKCHSFSFIYSKKKLIVNSQVCNIIFFLVLCELKKSLICSQMWNIIFPLTYVNFFFFFFWQAYKCVIPFTFPSYMSWKNRLQAFKCAISLLFFHLWE